MVFLKIVSYMRQVGGFLEDSQLHAAGRWQSPSIPISFTNETDCHDITEILLKVALNTTTQTLTFFSDVSLIDLPSFIQKQFGMNHNPTKSCIQ